MAKYTRFESVNMLSTRGAKRIFDAVSSTDVENGTFGYIEELATGEDVTYTFHPGTKAGATLVVVDNPAWDYDTCKRSNQRRDKYVVPAGVKFCARELALNDEFGITVDGVTTATQSEMKKDAFLTIDTTGKLVAASATAKTSSSTPQFEAKVMRARTSGTTLSTTARTYGYSAVIYEAKVTILS